MKRRDETGEKYPSRRPIHASNTCWFYEERGGICVVIDQSVKGGALIPWRLIRKSSSRAAAHKSKSAKGR